MTGDIPSQIALLDSMYQKITKCRFKPTGVVTGREQTWFAFIKAGYSLDELIDVLNWLMHRIKLEKRDIGAVRFSSLIGNLDRFSEEQSLMVGQKRNAKAPPKPRDLALRQLRPSVDPVALKDPSDAKHVSEFIRKLRESVDRPPP